MPLTLASGKDVLSENTAHEITHRFRQRWGGNLGLADVQKLQAVLREMDAAEAPPVHPFEVRISIGGNTRKYVVETLEDIAREIEEGRGEVVSGGYSGCHSVTIATRDISPDDYRKELTAWMERQK